MVLLTIEAPGSKSDFPAIVEPARFIDMINQFDAEIRGLLDNERQTLFEPPISLPSGDAPFVEEHIRVDVVGIGNYGAPLQEAVQRGKLIVKTLADSMETVVDTAFQVLLESGGHLLQKPDSPWGANEYQLWVYRRW